MKQFRSTQVYGCFLSLWNRGLFCNYQWLPHSYTLSDTNVYFGGEAGHFRLLIDWFFTYLVSQIRRPIWRLHTTLTHSRRTQSATQGSKAIIWTKLFILSALNNLLIFWCCSCKQTVFVSLMKPPIVAYKSVIILYWLLILSLAIDGDLVKIGSHYTKEDKFVLCCNFTKESLFKGKNSWGDMNSISLFLNSFFFILSHCFGRFSLLPKHTVPLASLKELCHDILSHFCEVQN